MARAVKGSFRDPAGVVYEADGRLYRQLHSSAREAWEAAEQAGLFRELIDAGLLVDHRDVGVEHALDDRCWKVIAPRRVPFVSFPYEWSVRQLLDAALLTLEVHCRAISKGFGLKDASAYNVQFVRGRAVFIDTLSLEPWTEGEPWVAYGQFCRHFLAPIALYSWFGPRLRGLLRANIDGIPLDLASAMLPASSWLRLGLLSHLHLHARATSRYASDTEPSKAEGGGSVSRAAMLGLIDNLRSTLLALDSPPKGTEWGDYYAATNYSDRAAESKSAQVKQALEGLRQRGNPVRTVWDLGANTGVYSRVAADVAEHVVAFDVDETAVDRHWRAVSAASPPPPILPLFADLTNPSPSLGWASEERPSLAARGPADVVMALALIHHLAISNNTPLDRIAAWLATVGRDAVVEMVPKEDSQVKRLLATREDVFPDYTPEGFEAAFGQHFEILDRLAVAESSRVLYVLSRRER